MNILLPYILKLSISLAAVYLFYRLMLRRLTFYNWNRWYLVIYTLLSFFIPFINIYPVLQKNNWSSIEVLEYIPVVNYQPAVPVTKINTPWSYQEWTLVCIAAGVLIMLLRLVLQQLSFLQIRRSAKLIIDDTIKVYQVDTDIIPFSFGNSIFVNQQQHSQEELKEIIRHEFIHVKQKHTWDIVWCECLCILNWYNPFAWLIRQSVRQNLEFIADNKVLENGIDKKEYQYLLLKVTGISHFSIAPQFNFSSLKKRIAMMNKMKSAKLHLVKFLFMLPLVALLLVAFRNNYANPGTNGKNIVTYEGIIVDIISKEPVSEVVVTDRFTGKKAVADNNGYFHFEFEPETDKLEVELDFNKEGYSKQKASFTIDYNQGTDNKSKGIKELIGMKKGEAGEKCEGCFSSMSLKYENEQEKIGYTQVKKLYEGILQPDKTNTDTIPENVKRISVTDYTATVKLKNGKTETYDLRIKEVKDAFIKKYGELPSPPPPPGAPVLSVTPVSPPVPSTPPTAIKNDKGYVISIADNNGECIVIVKDKEGKIVKAMELTEWNNHEQENAAKYGELPPPSPPKKPVAPAAPVKRKVAKVSIFPDTPDVPSPGIDHGVITAPSQDEFFVKPLTKNHNPIQPSVRISGNVTTKLDLLFIIDGVQQPTGVNPLSQIDPSDIENIHIVKDPGATAVYGEKARNGAVLITTKKKKPTGHIKGTGTINDEDKISKIGNVNLNKPDNFNGLFIVDEKEYDKKNFEALHLAPEIIESVTILKGESATKLYGDKAKEGAIIIVTKQKPVTKSSTIEYSKTPIKIVEGKGPVKIMSEKPPAMNTLYIGIENRLIIEMEGVNSNELEVRIERGTIRKRNGVFFAVLTGIPDTNSKVDIYRKDITGKLELLQSKYFRVSVLPYPQTPLTHS